MKDSRWLPPIIGFITLLSLLEVLVRQDYLSASLFPAPSSIIKVLIEMKGDFTKAFFETANHVIQGYLLSIFLGTLLAVLFSLHSFLRRCVLPFALFFQTVPIIAVAPLLVIYFGFGPPTVIASALIVSIFPIIANTLVGLDSITKSYIELFKIYRASKWQVLWRLRLPLATTALFAGVRISAGLAVIGAVAGEFVAGGGLGALVDSARTQQRIDIVFAAILLLSVLGWLLVNLVNLTQYLLNRWRPFSNWSSD